MKDETLYALNVGAMGGCVAIMIHGLMDWVFWWNAITRTYFLLAAMIFAIKYWRYVNERPALAPKPRPTRPTRALPAPEGGADA